MKGFLEWDLTDGMARTVSEKQSKTNGKSKLRNACQGSASIYVESVADIQKQSIAGEICCKEVRA